VVIGALAAPAAFVAVWRWTDDATDALIACAIVASDPVHARFSASEDPMPLAALCAWLALLGVALDRRDRRPEGAWLAAGALGFAMATKADAVLWIPGFAALWWATPVEAHARPTAHHAAAAAALAGLAGAIAFTALRTPEYMANPRYGGMTLATYAQHAAELPIALVAHNPLGDPRYAAPAVTLLAYLGLARGCARRDRAALACAGFLGVLFVRVYEDFPLPFDDLARAGPRWFFRAWYPPRMGAGVKGDARWNLHAMVPWTLLAVAGARTRGGATGGPTSASPSS